ncbi:DotU family type IV/VI secretion system protein, partial [Pseudomonas aeruginosa]|nr:DotU family type IV/VI secretion system protein [Pseudomonas aeruginosa]
CLILGFRGRLRGPRGEALHEKWRQALFAFAWQREADAADLGRRLEQPAAAPPRRLPVRAALPDGFRLGLAVLGLVLLMNGIGHLFWRDIQHEMAAVTHLADAEQAP